MDLARLERLDAYSWSLRFEPGQERLPVVLFGSHSLLETMDDKVLQQVSNVARLPGLVGSVLTMPDAHWGYGFPIGGVAAFDPDQGGIISAGGVGFDISCGIRCLRTNVTWFDVAAHAEELADALFRVIPAGVGEEGELRLSPPELDELLMSGAEWAVEHGFGTKADLEYVEERGRIDGARPENVSDLAKRRQHREMGTLGSGNHYLELQVVERIFDAAVASAFGLQQDQVLISIHCGSRGLVHQIGTDYLVSMAKGAQRLGTVLPDRELASAPICSREGQQYLGAMRAGINCALANRQILTHLTRRVIAQVFPEATLETLYDVAHNTCKAERHMVDGQSFLTVPVPDPDRS
jgi:tRNA-splicing ligase RtcB